MSAGDSVVIGWNGTENEPYKLISASVDYQRRTYQEVVRGRALDIDEIVTTYKTEAITTESYRSTTASRLDAKGADSYSVTKYAPGFYKISMTKSANQIVGISSPGLTGLRINSGLHVQ